MKYLSDVLSTEEKHSLFYEQGLQLCVATTGAGKTYLMLEEMKKEFENAKPFGLRQTLLLVNRSSLLEQYLQSIDETFNDKFENDGYYQYQNNIHVMTYQKLFKSIQSNEAFLTNFHLILMDEAHYFLQDSWNDTTDFVFDKIVERAEHIPCTMFTATPEELIEYAQVREIELKKYDYSSEFKHDRITCVATNKDFKEIINGIPIAEKYILFVNNKYSKDQIEKLADELSNDVRCIGFYYSRWNKRGKAIIKNALMDARFKNLVKLHKFEENGVVANAAVDNGVDFKDEDLKHIILLDHYDPVTMKQMIGRKRFNFDKADDKLKVWVINTDRRFLEREEEKTKQQMELYRAYKELNAGALIERFADRLKEVKLHSDSNEIAEKVTAKSTIIAETDTVPCIKVVMMPYKDDLFKPKFIVNYTLVAKSQFRLRYLDRLLNSKIQYNNDKPRHMALHKIMAQQLEDMGYKDVYIDHKNTFHENLAKKYDQAINLEQNLIPFLEGQIGKTMNKDTFKEFRQFLFDTFGIKTEKGKIVGKSFLERFLTEKGYKLFTSSMNRKTTYVLAK